MENDAARHWTGLELAWTMAKLTGSRHVLDMADVEIFPNDAILGDAV
jgi:hypothetical protein